MLTGLRHLILRVGPWPRRVLALGCLAMAAVTALGAKPQAEARAGTTPVVVSVRDLPSGHLVRAADLRVRAWPATTRPAHAVARSSALVGRTLAGPIGRGDPVTPLRLLGADLTAGLDRSEVAAALALDDLHAADLVHAGSHVDVIGTPREADTEPADPGGSDNEHPAADGAAPTGDGDRPTATGQTLARDVLVLAVLPATADDPAVELIIATDAGTAARLAGQKVRMAFAVLARAP